MHCMRCGLIILTRKTAGGPTTDWPRSLHHWLNQYDLDFQSPASCGHDVYTFCVNLPHWRLLQKRAYRCSAPAVRNSRPKTVFTSDSATVFNSRLKTFLFSRAFSLPFTLPGPGSYDLMALYKCVYFYYFFMAAGRKTRLDIQTYGCNSNLLCDHGVAEKTAFPLCRAIERRWKRNVVSRVSSVIVVIRLHISCVSSVAISMANK